MIDKTAIEEEIRVIERVILIEDDVKRMSLNNKFHTHRGNL